VSHGFNLRFDSKGLHATRTTGCDRSGTTYPASPAKAHHPREEKNEEEIRPAVLMEEYLLSGFQPDVTSLP